MSISNISEFKGLYAFYIFMTGQLFGIRNMKYHKSGSQARRIYQPAPPLPQVIFQMLTLEVFFSYYSFFLP